MTMQSRSFQNPTAAAAPGGSARPAQGTVCQHELIRLSARTVRRGRDEDGELVFLQGVCRNCFDVVTLQERAA